MAKSNNIIYGLLGIGTGVGAGIVLKKFADTITIPLLPSNYNLNKPSVAVPLFSGFALFIAGYYTEKPHLKWVSLGYSVGAIGFAIANMLNLIPALRMQQQRNTAQFNRPRPVPVRAVIPAQAGQYGGRSLVLNPSADPLANRHNYRNNMHPPPSQPSVILT